MIYKVASTEFLSLRERPLRDPDEDRYLALIKDLIKSSPLYFSYTFDITSSFQRQSEEDLSLPLWKRADDRFFWNRFVQSDFIDFRLGKAVRFGQAREQPAVDPYILPVMFGMLEIRNTSIKGTPFTFALISRRSRFRSGTRYFSRGIDEEGNVSNFNETEQIVVLNDDGSRGPVSYEGDAGMDYAKLKAVVGKEAQVLTYLQTRGSVPVFWAEMNNLHYVPQLQIWSVDSALRAAQKHFDEQIQKYGDNYLVNLVNQKGREQRVKEAYERLVRTLVTSPASSQAADEKSAQALNVIESKGSKNKYDHLHYIYFDFHNETKGLQWHRAKLLLNQLEPNLIKGGYFKGVDLPADSKGSLEVRSKQSAVVRTNCMDCLDRTNVVQSMLGEWALGRMLVDLRILKTGESIRDDHAFYHLFRNMWADNANAVSTPYSGTPALKTDFTRTGERTKRGMFVDFTNSSTRYIKNNFLDGPRQDAFDVFHGKYRPAMTQLGKASIFADSRPIVIQSVPYVLIACSILILVGSFTRRDDNAAVWPLRLVMIIAFAIATYCLQFMWSNGVLYVSSLHRLVIQV
jgi:phosphatidylinositol 4-phosphatase